MAYIDYYKILEIDKTATSEQVKKAYRKLARKYHPDLNPGDENAKKKFQEINEAHEVLSDAEKRKKFDQYGENWKHAEQFEKAGNTSGYRSGPSNYQDADDDFSDFFSSMFGGQSRGRTRVFKGQDFNASLQLNLTDVLEDNTQTLTVNNKKIRLTIPAGVEDNQTIKISGQGGPGSQGGPAGDLYITFKIANNSAFERRGNNLYSNIEIDLFTAVLGGEITVETLTGKVKLTIKPGSQSGEAFKLKGKGLPVYKRKGESGDLIVKLKVIIPKDLSQKEIELYKELKQIRYAG